MKRLTNASPFLLLLVPVFMMIAITLMFSPSENNNTEVSAKDQKSIGVIFKKPAVFFK